MRTGVVMHHGISRKYAGALSGYGDTKVSATSTTVRVLQRQHQQPTEVQKSQNGLSNTKLGGPYVPWDGEGTGIFIAYFQLFPWVESFIIHHNPSQISIARCLAA
jgi:hypothetical protein